MKPADIQPLAAAAKPVILKDVFADYLAYLRHSNTQVEQTYQLEKAGAFARAGTPAGKAFVDERLAAGAIELRDLIYTAWIKSAEPVPAYTGNLIGLQDSVAIGLWALDRKACLARQRQQISISAY